MSLGDRITGAVTERSRLVVVVLLVVTAGVGFGATMVESSSSVNQFQSDTPEARAQTYVEENFRGGDANTTAVQIIVRNEDGNVLSRASLLRSLRYQRALRENPEINATLANETAVIGVSNVVAITAIRLEQVRNLTDRVERLQARNESLAERRRELRADRRALRERSRELNATADRLSRGLNETRRLQVRYDRLNLSYRRGEISREEYRQRAADIRAAFASVRENATAGLDAEEAATWTRARDQVRRYAQDLFYLEVALQRGEITEAQYERRRANLTSRLEAAYEAGVRGPLADEFRALRERGERLRERGEQLKADGEALRADFRDLQRRRAALANATRPSLAEQIDQLASMNDSAVREVVVAVLSKEGPRQLFEAATAGLEMPAGNATNATGPGNGSASGGLGFGGSGGEQRSVFRLMSVDYTPGSPTASARVMIVRQVTAGGTPQGPSGAGEAIVSAQVTMRELAPSDGGEEYIVFGFGLISDEIDRSMRDSLLLVAPLALVFVLLTLLVAYRDPLDILLGFVGIFVVLLWTFGFMGWADIAFNQIMVAVPVLLIGLSIDYAIHIFMRHREQRQEVEAGPRGSMRVALAGVGVALVWVTATTVIGFLSNLISPLPPIRDFGVVSSVGIVATLVVFGALVPALKVELDDLLESWGFDRKKRAFGTGGGYLGRALSVGAVAARRAPAVVIVLSLLVTAAGAYGGSQVDTSFSQEDFLAEDPPGWMDRLPEPFRPSEYTAKANLEYVNENFQREDSQVQVLVRGEVATPRALQRFDRAERRAAESDVAFVLSSGETSIESPLRTMRAVAATNESFNATFRAADTDGDGVPDRNVEAVFDALFAAAPERASDVIRRKDGRYVAARMVVATKGGASTGTVTQEARAFAGILEGKEGDTDGLTAVATGSQVVNQVVQEDLFETVIQSLVISLVAVFVFLMIAYRLAHGSATLGAVTLLPVALSVAWILGTMFVLGMPFNVLTGMITSLTIGLGVAYSIHVSERYRLELERLGDVEDAMSTAVTGTGGALLGSAATTVGGFGTLAIAILPPLQQFGIITGMTIIYAFAASVLVLPSLLTVWTRFAGPDVPTEAADSGADAITGVADSGPDGPAEAPDSGPGAGPPGADGEAAATTPPPGDGAGSQPSTDGDAVPTDTGDPGDTAATGGADADDAATDAGEPGDTAATDGADAAAGPGAGPDPGVGEPGDDGMPAGGDGELGATVDDLEPPGSTDGADGSAGDSPADSPETDSSPAGGLDDGAEANGVEADTDEGAAEGDDAGSASDDESGAADGMFGGKAVSIPDEEDGEDAG